MKILWIGESPRLSTGFGRVTREVTNRLRREDKYQIGVLGWGQHQVGPQSDDIHFFNPGPRAWDNTRIDQVIEEYAPDVVITSGHAFDLVDFPQSKYRPAVHWIGYSFFEGYYPPSHISDTMSQMDVSLVPSEFCNIDKKSIVVPLGVEPAIFYPKPDKEKLKHQAGFAGNFIVGFVGKNCFRKQIPVLLEAFDYFSQRYPDTLLYLHTDPRDEFGWDLGDLVQNRGLQEKVVFTKGLVTHQGVTNRVLTQIYNLFDVFVMPSMGESFCLPVYEAMACGVPPIVTDHMVYDNLHLTFDQQIDTPAKVVLPFDNCAYVVTDPISILDSLTTAYTNPKKLSKWRENSIEKVKMYTWDSTARRIISIIDSVGATLEGGIKTIQL